MACWTSRESSCRHMEDVHSATGPSTWNAQFLIIWRTVLFPCLSSETSLNIFFPHRTSTASAFEVITETRYINYLLTHLLTYFINLVGLSENTESYGPSFEDAQDKDQINRDWESRGNWLFQVSHFGRLAVSIAECIKYTGTLVLTFRLWKPGYKPKKTLSFTGQTHLKPHPKMQPKLNPISIFYSTNNEIFYHSSVFRTFKPTNLKILDIYSMWTLDST